MRKSILIGNGESNTKDLNFWISQLEKYDRSKIVTECLLSGTDEQTANIIANRIDQTITKDMRMSEIRPLILSLLHRFDPAAATHFRTNETYVRTSSENFESFNNTKIAKSIIKETGINEQIAMEIAEDIENFIKRLNLSFISSPMIREIVCVKLLEHGLEEARKKYSRLGIPTYDVEQMINKGISTDIKRENANLQHTPETINWIISGEALEQYSLLRLIPGHLADPHLSGDYHIHILSNIATRPNCIQHFPPLFFKYGLKADGTGRHTSVAGPAKHIGVAIQHCAKIMLASQTQMAGGQSIDSFNVWLAPFLKGLDVKEVKQAAQEFIYELNQSYVARGGQVVFSNLNFEFGIPDWIKNIPAVGPGGEIKGVYGDYEEEANSFLREYVKVKIKGDYVGKQHMFPNDAFKVRANTFHKYKEELDLVHEFIAKYGTPYIANGIPEWQTENFNYMGCLAGDTQLPYFNDGGEHITSIKELAEKYFKNYGEKKFGISIYTEPKNNLSVWSWNKETNKLEKKKVLKIIKNPPTNILTIKATKGKEIKVTKDHPFYRVSRNKYWLKAPEEIIAGKLKIGDRILVPRRLSDNNAKISPMAELFGFFAGDGTILNLNTINPVIQFNFKANSDHLVYLKELCKRCNLKLEVNKTYHSRDKAEYVNCYIKNKELCKQFNIEAYYNNEKNVPDWILENKDNMLGFLTGIINSDGYVRQVNNTKTKPLEILITSTSNRIANSTMLILAHFGLDYNIRKQKSSGKKSKKPVYRISIHGKYAHHILSRIPLAPRHKKFEFKKINLDNDKIIKSVKIKDIIETPGIEPVYDLEVADNHTFISGQGLFIHSNCRTRLDSKFAGVWGSIRTGNDLYITLNLPRIAYEARGNDDRFFEILQDRLQKMAEILIIKHKISDDILHKQNLLQFLSQKFDGEEYYNLMNTTKTFGYAGLTEATKIHCGYHLHENSVAQSFGLKIITKIRDYANEMAKKTGLRFSVIASPAETCAARLAKIDIIKFKDKDLVYSGTKEDPYYTNSHMVKMDAQVNFSDKIKIEEPYHPLTNGGHILHVWLGENSPSPEALLDITKKLCTKTNMGFFAYTRDYSTCNHCNQFGYGLINQCTNCGKDDLSRYSRITGYYQQVEGWNPSKKQELKDRYRFSNSTINT